MSENKPHPEADAVLSTVRRIVNRGASEPSDEHAPLATERPTERLLLTPSLRVDPVQDATEPEPELPPRRRPRVTTRTLTAERITLEQRIAELEKAVSDDGSWEPDGSEEVDTETPRRFPFPKPHAAEVEDVTILSDSVAAPAQGEQVSEAATLRFRPDPVEMAPEPKSEPAPKDKPETATSVDEGIEGIGADLIEESVIDEEMLRDIVAEIVRQELQGELGERITRNVRKLVRREIHRAIMTRDFG